MAPNVDVAPGETDDRRRASAGPQRDHRPVGRRSTRRPTTERARLRRHGRSRSYWDGEKSPSVWSPLGDFFGTGARAQPVQVAAAGRDRGWRSTPTGICRSRKEAVVELINEGKTPFAAQFMITHAPLDEADRARSARFHAKWHRDAFLPTEPERWIDWPMLKTEGTGRFCGVALEVWNPQRRLVGRGRREVLRRRREVPVHHRHRLGGLLRLRLVQPDACSRTPITTRPRNDNTNNASHVSVNRWQITDNIPFQKSFDGYIEKYYVNNRPTLYAATAYWYLSADGKDPYKAVAAKDLANWYVRPVDQEGAGRL